MNVSDLLERAERRCPRRPVYGPLLLASLLVSCITVNVYFPAAEIEATAEKIVDEVRPDVLPPAPEADGEASSLRWRSAHLISFQLAAIGGLGSAADETDGDPVVQKITASLKKRYEDLLPFYRKLALGETRLGLLEKRDVEELPLAERRALEKLIEAENKDRMNLYERVAVLKDVERSRLKEIQAIFAEKWIEKAKEGWWVQDEESKWIKKPRAPTAARRLPRTGGRRKTLWLFEETLALTP